MKKILNWIANIPKDKLLHFGISAAATIFASHLCMRYCEEPPVCINVGVGVGLALGFIKELFDSFDKDNAFSWSDILADVLGCLSGAAIAAIPFV